MTDPLSWRSRDARTPGHSGMLRRNGIAAANLGPDIVNSAVVGILPASFADPSAAGHWAAGRRLGEMGAFFLDHPVEQMRRPRFPQSHIGIGQRKAPRPFETAFSAVRTAEAGDRDQVCQSRKESMSPWSMVTSLPWMMPEATSIRRWIILELDEAVS